MKESRLYQLDLFRFIAAMLVVLFHYTFRGYIANSSILEFPILGSFFKYGYLGVNLFFLISGFVIYMSIENSSVLDFIKARIVRLYPAFWICVTLTTLVIYIWGGQTFNVSFRQYLANMTMLNGFVGIDHVDGVYWTLLLELRFYLLIGLALCFNKIKTKYINILIVGWLIISFSQLLIDFNSHIILKFFREFLIISYSSYFISGILLYKIYKERNTLKFTPVLILSYILSIKLSVNEAESLSVLLNVTFNNVIIFLYLTIFYCAMYLVSIHKLNYINKSMFLRIGLLTYPLYLIHQNIGFVIFNKYGTVINKYLLLLVMIILAIIVSYLINKYIEKPLNKKMSIILSRI